MLLLVLKKISEDNKPANMHRQIGGFTRVYVLQGQRNVDLEPAPVLGLAQCYIARSIGTWRAIKG